MSTVAELADRVYRDYLHAPEDQPIAITLGADVNSTDTAWTYDDATLAPDEEDLLAPGVLIECGTEQCRISDVDHDANTLTVLRGVNGTSKTTHLEDDDILVAPVFSRKSVVDAVMDGVVTLYPSLWRVATETITVAESYVEVPEEAITLESFLWTDGTNYYPGNLPTLLSNFPPSSTNKAVVHFGAPTDRTGYLTYRAKFTRPSTEATELFDLGVQSEWERIVVVGAAAQVVSGRPPDALTAEYITEQLEREALPPGSANRIRNGLLKLRSVWIDEAARILRADQHTPVQYLPTRRQ